MFDGTAMNISTEGHQHLGAVLGSRKHLEDYVEEKAEDWISRIVRLAEFARPQASYVASTFGLRHRCGHTILEHYRISKTFWSL